MSSPERHAAIVLGLSAAGGAVARALAARGVCVFGVDGALEPQSRSWRGLHRDARFAGLAPGPGLLEGLLELGAEQASRPVIYATTDAYLGFVVEHDSELRRHFILSSAMRPETGLLLLDDWAFQTRARDLGVETPRTFFPDSAHDTVEAAREIRYPALVKPLAGQDLGDRLRGEKLVEVDGPEVLLRWWNQFREWGVETLLREVVPGPERNIFVAGLYVDAHGTCRSLFTACKARQYPARYGSGCYLEACWMEEIATRSLELVKELGFSGLCATEFKWDPRDESWKLIELHGRPSLWFALPRAAGVDLVWDAHCDLIGHPNPVRWGVQDDRMRWQLPGRDLMTCLEGLRGGELGLLELVRTALDPRHKVYGDSAWRIRPTS